MSTELISKAEREHIKFKLRKWCVEQGFYLAEDVDALYAWVTAGGFREIDERKWAISEAMKQPDTRYLAKSTVEVAQKIYDWVTTDNLPILWPRDLQDPTLDYMA
jgi:hypothetical protein